MKVAKVRNVCSIVLFNLRPVMLQERCSSHIYYLSTMFAKALLHGGHAHNFDCDVSKLHHTGIWIQQFLYRRVMILLV